MKEDHEILALISEFDTALYVIEKSGANFNVVVYSDGMEMLLKEAYERLPLHQQAKAIPSLMISRQGRNDKRIKFLLDELDVKVRVEHEPKDFFRDFINDYLLKLHKDYVSVDEFLKENSGTTSESAEKFRLEKMKNIPEIAGILSPENIFEQVGFRNRYLANFISGMENLKYYIEYGTKFEGKSGTCYVNQADLIIEGSDHIYIVEEKQSISAQNRHNQKMKAKQQLGLTHALLMRNFNISPVLVYFERRRNNLRIEQFTIDERNNIETIFTTSMNFFEK